MICQFIKLIKLNQLDLFRCFRELGYDSQKLAFNYLSVDVEHYRAVEFDKYAIQSLNDIHNTNFPALDITQIKGGYLGIEDTDKYTYVMTYSFPCTDLSLAGKKAGMKKGSNTRSGLLWEVERLLNEVDNLPQILIMENVPQVLTSNGWRDWVSFLEGKGYSNYAEILNAKNFGIPQNRKRCFMVSILGKYNYKFPKGFELRYRLKDLLERNVDESYYLSDKFLDLCLEINQKPSKFPRAKRFLESLTMTNDKGLATTISTKSGNRPVDNFIIGNKRLLKTLQENENKPHILGKYCRGGFSSGQIVDKDYIAPTFMEKHGKIMGIFDYKSSPNYRNRMFDDSVIPTLYAQDHYGIVENQPLRIRKLTPKECFKLMGVKPSDYYRAKYGFNNVFDLEGDEENCVNASLKVAKEKLLQEDMETYVCCTTKEFQDMEVFLKTKWRENTLKEKIENKQHVSIVIEKLEEVEQKDCVINITKCLENTEILNSMIKNQEGKYTFIIELKDKQSTEKYMKISWEENLNKMKQFITLILIKRIIESKIFTYIQQKAIICGHISSIINLKNLCLKMKLLNLKMVDISKQRQSKSRLYKQAGNSIVTTCLMAIYSQLFDNLDYKKKINELLEELIEKC